MDGTSNVVAIAAGYQPPSGGLDNTRRGEDVHRRTCLFARRREQKVTRFQTATICKRSLPTANGPPGERSSISRRPNSRRVDELPPDLNSSLPDHRRRETVTWGI